MSKMRKILISLLFIFLFACFNTSYAELSKIVEVAVVTVDDVIADGAEKISAVGNTEILHFVTPKGAGNVTLTATISPDNDEVKNEIIWEGASQDASDRLKATVSKTSVAKHIIKIKVAGEVIKELRVWVVWADLAGGVAAPVATLVTSSTGLRVGTSISVSFNSMATIRPFEITTDADRPNLEGANTVMPPGGTNSCGQALSGGANRKWDMSRRIAIRAETNANNPALTLGCLDNTDNFPADPIIGNDDAGPGDEDNDPYANGGTLKSFDPPMRTFSLGGGNVGDTYMSRLWFQEFARLQIGNSWFVISDPLRWRVEFRFIKRLV